MTKRFCDSEIWHKDWFLKLNDTQKLLTKFIFDNCDCAGIYEISWRMLQIFFSNPITKEDFEKIKQVRFLDENTIIVEDFILFQCGIKSLKDLNPNNNAHKGIIKRLQKFNIDLGAKQPLSSPCQAPAQPPLCAAQEKEKEKEEEYITGSVLVERESARARDKRYISNDPFLDVNVQKFIGAWREKVKKPCRLSPDERLKLWNIINDLLMQGLTIDDVCSAACGNFQKINSRNDFGINWMLKDDNFYSIINGEWQKKPPPKKTAQAKPLKTPQEQADAAKAKAKEYAEMLANSEDYDEKKHLLTADQTKNRQNTITRLRDGLRKKGLINGT